MKTKITALMLGATILLTSSSCFVKVGHGRRHHRVVVVHEYVQPAVNGQQSGSILSPNQASPTSILNSFSGGEGNNVIHFPI